LLLPVGLDHTLSLGRVWISERRRTIRMCRADHESVS
jgi:hypothetical protein